MLKPLIRLCFYILLYYTAVKITTISYSKQRKNAQIFRSVRFCALCAAKEGREKSRP